MVEYIKEFRAELHRHPFGEIGSLDEGHVPVIRTRCANQITACAPEAAERGTRERTSAEPAGQLLINSNRGNHVGPLCAAANSCAIGRDADIKRRPGFKSRNAGHLPTVEHLFRQSLAASEEGQLVNVT